MWIKILEILTITASSLTKSEMNIWILEKIMGKHYFWDIWNLSFRIKKTFIKNMYFFSLNYFFKHFVSGNFSKKSGEIRENFEFSDFLKNITLIFNGNFWFSKNPGNKMFEKIIRWEKINIFLRKCFYSKANVPNISKIMLPRDFSKIHIFISLFAKDETELQKL